MKNLEVRAFAGANASKLTVTGELRFPLGQPTEEPT
jgi:hypothetical protein